MGVYPEVVDRRVCPQGGRPFELDIELKPFQREAVEKALKLTKAVIHGSVSSGKTVIAAGIVSRLGLPFLYVTHRQDIARQTYERFKAWFPDSVSVGLCTGGTRVRGESLVATYQSLKDLPLDFPILLVDECHRVVSEAFTNAVSNCDAFYRFAFTGTPRGRSDALDTIMDKLLGPVVQVADYDTIKRENLACDAKFIFVVVQEDLPVTDPSDFHNAETLFIVGGQKRNELIKTVCESRTKEGVTLVIVRRREHGLYLQKMIKNALFIDSSSPASRRDEARKLQSGVLIATGVIEEGIDNPNIDVLVNAAGGKSSIVTKQRIGRGLRFKEGKVLKVIDFVDLAHPLLFKHSFARYKIYKRLSDDIVFLSEEGRIVESPFGQRRRQSR